MEVRGLGPAIIRNDRQNQLTDLLLCAAAGEMAHPGRSRSGQDAGSDVPRIRGTGAARAPSSAARTTSVTEAYRDLPHIDRLASLLASAGKIQEFVRVAAAQPEAAGTGP
jgi:hypothetical protein